MSVVEDYVTLGLRLGRHVDGLVDAYYGPPELADAVEAEDLRPAAALLADAESLLVGLESTDLDEARRGSLQDQARGLHTYARVLAGEGLGYLDEVEGCYGVRPERVPEATFAAAHERLDELLPGAGSLEERYEAWRAASFVPAERIEELMRPMLAVLRRLTATVVELPGDEEFTLELVANEPWAAFNYYAGGGRSRIAVNSDFPFTAAELVHLAAHEGYPGHHTEHAVKERLLFVEGGYLEESIFLVPTPQALISEGIAEAGPELLVDDAADDELAQICATAGVSFDPAATRRIREAREPLGVVTRNAAILIHEDGMSVEDARAYVARWALAPPHRAERMVDFVVDPTWRAYVTTYTEGKRLCRAYVDGDVARLRRLLTEPVRVADLLATVSSGP
ncbi:MAG: hypothetical protein H0T13_02405 [Actinobacteria bacterium]|nr:hypothetical protein [Actinomycetota bacterium]